MLLIAAQCAPRQGAPPITARLLAWLSADYACLIVGANAGIVGMCKEHLGVALALKVPVFFVVTKVGGLKGAGGVVGGWAGVWKVGAWVGWLAGCWRLGAGFKAAALSLWLARPRQLPRTVPPPPQSKTQTPIKQSIPCAQIDLAPEHVMKHTLTTLNTILKKPGVRKRPFLVSLGLSWLAGRSAGWLAGEPELEQRRGQHADA